MGLNVTIGKKSVYALGQFGLVLCAFAVGNLFVSFFVTRTFLSVVVFPVYIHQGFLFSLFTIAGLIIALSRIFDAAAGLYFGYASDCNNMARGRRTGFMLIAALPVAIFSVLVFFPPTAEAVILNSIYVLVCTLLFYILLSLYTTPYLALLAELGKNPRERVQLTTMMAIATALASLMGNRLVFFMDMIRQAFDISFVASFRVIIILYAFLSLVCMMLPVIFIDEKAGSTAMPVKDSFSVSLHAVLKDTYFRPFFIAEIMYRIAFSFTLAGFSYYVTGLLSLSSKTVSFFVLVIFFSNVILFVPVGMLSRVIGKRKLLFTAFLFFIFALIASTFAGEYPFDPFLQGIVLSVLVAIPLSVFTVIPYALVSDLVVAAERKTGIQRGGMYFGVHSLAIKIGQLISVLLFSSIMTIGSVSHRSAGPAGLRITLVLAVVFLILGFLFLFGYREKEIAVLLENNNHA